MTFVSEETARRIADSLERLEGELARLAGSRSPAEKPSAPKYAASWGARCDQPKTFLEFLLGYRLASWVKRGGL